MYGCAGWSEPFNTVPTKFVCFIVPYYESSTFFEMGPVFVNEVSELMSILSYSYSVISYIKHSSSIMYFFLI